MLRPSNPTPVAAAAAASSSSSSSSSPTTASLTRQTSLSDLIQSGLADPFERQYFSNGLLRQPSLSDLMDFDIDMSDLTRDSEETEMETTNHRQHHDSSSDGVSTTASTNTASSTNTNTTATNTNTNTATFRRGRRHCSNTRARSARMRREGGIVMGISLQRRRPVVPERPTQPVFSSDSSISSMKDINITRSSTSSSVSSNSDSELRRQTPPNEMERPSNPIPWHGGRRSAWMGDQSPPLNEFDSPNPATSATTTPTPTAGYTALWKIEEAGTGEIGSTSPPPGGDLESQRKFDRCIASIVELAMDADISSREHVDVEEKTKLLNMLKKADQMLKSLTTQAAALVNLPGVFKVLIRSCLSHQQVELALQVYNLSLTCGVVVSESEFQRLCVALEERGEETQHYLMN